MNGDNFIPIPNPKYVPYGVAQDLATIIASGKFITTYIIGVSGYGKTLCVLQVAAYYKREVIRLNCTPFTNEDEMIGHYILENGNMVWKDGPVLFAMQRGAILLLDEVDALDPKRGAFPLFSMLEGNGVFVKRLNKRFLHAPGFTVIATGNTKGKGDAKGRHAGTNIQNEAFLDRFTVTLEHGAPPIDVERKILSMINESGDLDFVERIIEWCGAIRSTYAIDGCDEVISTRRACDIINLYSLFKDRLKVINLATAKFNTETKESFIELYEKFDATPSRVGPGGEVRKATEAPATEDYGF